MKRFFVQTYAKTTMQKAQTVHARMLNAKNHRMKKHYEIQIISFNMCGYTDVERL